ncbi:MAG TPA: hypothetical protein VGR37_13120 [Longimicrobiaceae bacterium]|nr:hypothetical protein [Longimicrobiaceae bacterium]
MSKIRLVRPLLLLALLLAAGCGDPAGSGDRPRAEDELVFLRAAEGTPPLESQTVSFVARVGDNARAEIRYVNNGYGYEKCLEFRIPGNGLLRRPDGRRFQRGDTVRITITVVDPARFDFRFEPSGLRFDPDHPAELRVSYRWADRDYNGDGTVDDRDERFEREFGFWHQGRAGQPWSRMGTVKLEDLREAKAEITGFSRYALAGGY